MHDLFLIFVILLVLLTLISALGGSIYPSQKKIDTFGPHQHEMFNAEYEGGAGYQEEDQVDDGIQDESSEMQPPMDPSMEPSMDEPMEAEDFVDNMVPQGTESLMSANSAKMNATMPSMPSMPSMSSMSESQSMPGYSGMQESSSMPGMLPQPSSMPGMASQEGFNMPGKSEHHKEDFFVEGFDGDAYAAF